MIGLASRLVRASACALAVMVMCAQLVFAAPYAAVVMDARTGEVLHARNADTPLHPASLTKMMTLYIAFQAVERGEISPDAVVTITREAAAEPPSKLGLRTGQRIQFRFLMRAAAVKSANDAATAIGIAISGSEQAFTRRMTQTAHAMGMRSTRFLNANGLTEVGHMSTARDMSILGRHMIYDYPAYYNLFSRRTTNAGLATVANTNRRLLNNYRGADGIKTGYTRAAGFNLVSSAERGNTRIIATMFGGTSSAQRYERVAQLLDMGFSRAPRMSRVRRPRRPGAYIDNSAPPQNNDSSSQLVATANSGRTRRNSGLVAKSLRPQARVARAPAADAIAEANVIANALSQALADASVEAAVETNTDQASMVDQLIAEVSTRERAATPNLISKISPRARPNLRLALVSSDSKITQAEPLENEIATQPDAQPLVIDEAVIASITPNENVISKPLEVANVQPVASQQPVELEVVTRDSNTAGSAGVTVGLFNSRYEAERALMRIALNEMDTLGGSQRRVIQTSRGYEARFMGMNANRAQRACARLSAKAIDCSPLNQG